MFVPEDNLSECVLIHKCQGGVESAWRELIKRYDHRLRRSIRNHLRSKAIDEALIEELAADVWIARCGPKGALRRFDLQRGGFTTFLNLRARQAVRVYQRRVCPRRAREMPLDSRVAEMEDISWPLESWLEDFLATLPYREAMFCRAYRLGIPGS
jgi:hypothetical protein